MKKVLAIPLIGLFVISLTLAQEPRRGGDVVIAFETEPDLWDPHRVTAAQSFQMMNLLYDTLVVLDFDVATIHPHIATDWQISEDGLTYTFTLRDDVVFHSGRPMTSSDWQWTFERLLSPELGSPVAWRLGNVKEIETPDPYTLIIHLNEPNSDLLMQLTMSFLAVLDREVVEAYGDDYGIIFGGGTGPFKWERWDPGEELVLVRNENYTWGPAIHNNTGPAYVDRIRRRVIPERTTLLFELELNNIDIAINVPHSEIDRLQSVPRVNLVEVKPRPSVDFLGFKTTRPLMQDVNVRRAVSYAIDRQELAETVWYGYANPAPGIVLTETPGFSPDANWAFDDPERAIELLDEAGWEIGPDGIRVKDGERLELVLIAIATPLNEQLALALRSQLREVGIDLRLNLMDGQIFWGASRQDTFDIVRLDYGWNTTLDILNTYFHSRNIPSPNRQNWADRRTDELLDAATIEVDEEKRLQYLREVQNIIAEAAVWLPLVNVRHFYGTSERIRDFRPHGQYLLNIGKFLDVWVND